MKLGSADAEAVRPAQRDCADNGNPRSHCGCPWLPILFNPSGKSRVPHANKKPDRTLIDSRASASLGADYQWVGSWPPATGLDATRDRIGCSWRRLDSIAPRNCRDYSPHRILSALCLGLALGRYRPFQRIVAHLGSHYLPSVTLGDDGNIFFFAIRRPCTFKPTDTKVRHRYSPGRGHSKPVRGRKLRAVSVRYFRMT